MQANAGALAQVFERDVHCVLGLPFDAVDITGALERLRAAGRERRKCFLSTPNLNFLIGCRADARLRDSVINSDLSVADGMPVLWTARLLGVPLPERVAGATLLERLREPGPVPLKVYLFGGADGVAEAAARQINDERAGLVCVGYESPGFGDVEALSRPQSLARINASGADFLVVSLGAAKGQTWIERNRGRLDVPAIGHLGAALGFTAGALRRAPAWMQAGGLEWLWRIGQERALVRRYLNDGAAFLWLLATRVLPLAWLTRWHRPGREALETARTQVRRSGREIRIRLTGAWSQSNVARLRPLFRRAASSDKHVRVDLADTTYGDASLVGLLLVLYGAVRRRGGRFSCTPVSRPFARVLRLACAEFLLADAAHAADTAPEEAEQALVVR